MSIARAKKIDQSTMRRLAISYRLPPLSVQVNLICQAGFASEMQVSQTAITIAPEKTL
ncbi:uncharacterized protein CANTADRAFT_266713 [Suhomyces tanzawaensis NRRL Y-17324]|uniref:Uncharacterized protein n=1 Tax=Suhomyces tanzawaensis NRRL Y-17324 TaxID=984487 RepID=A0A1E4SGD0_9ASCO|nr:uncharacterized protein CANTADRAFT_266713 [Suhomyces tanzawaensis NRRL Y-17324]ODV78472.1 hypothetical protein CANTADRAFT_266713 [Suhomyces tanzawaensis NRRL Y-17324]